MADKFIHTDLSILVQAPDYLHDAQGYLSSALSSMRQYSTALEGSGFNRRNSSYKATYNSLYQAVSNVNTSAAEMEYNQSLIIQTIQKYEQGYIPADGVEVTDASFVGDPQTMAAATATVVAEAEADKKWYEVAWDWVKGVFEDIKSIIEKAIATFIDVVASLLQGLCKLVEDIVDCLVLIGGTLATWVCSGINFIFGTHIDTAAMKEAIMGFIATDWVGSAFNAFYEKTGFGNWLRDNSVIYGTKFRNILVGAGEWIGVAAICAVVTIFTCGAGTAPTVAMFGVTMSAGAATGAVVGAAKGMGAAAEKAYANGSGFYGGWGKALVGGAIGAVEGYCVGNVAGAAAEALYANSMVAVAEDGTVFAMRRVGSGVHTQWQWVAMDGSGAVAAPGTALVPIGQATSTALVPVGATGTALVPYAGAGALVPYTGAAAAGTILPNVLAYGSFGLGTVAAAAGAGGLLMGIIDPYQPGKIVSFGGGGTTPTPGPGGVVGTTDTTPTPEPTNETDTTPTKTEEPDPTDPKETDPKPTSGGDTDPLPTDPEPTQSGGGGFEPTPTNPEPTYESLPTSTQSVPTETQTQPTDSATQPTESETQPTESETQPTESETQPTESEFVWQDPIITNVGPTEIIIPSKSNVAPITGPGNGGNSGNGDIPRLDPNPPEYSEPPVTDPVATEPVYNWESAEPSVEAPIMENANTSVDSVTQVASKQIEIQAVETSGNATFADVNTISNLNNTSSSSSTYTNPGFDTSMLGMGSTLVGVGGATAYGAVRHNSEEDKEESSEFERKTEEEKEKIDGFNQF